ncbi:MAG: hypothetical protein HC830_13330 [Bacteroidetes bacterium]|nr:hypothetical protein [Bacteroidales bacterium]NJO70122.1 hypothetical protein [Bacteroidota bacterium]
MINPTLTFETKCYENDWQFLLKAGRLRKMIEWCDYKFDNRVLYINNVNDLDLVKKYADKCVSRNIIDSYIVVNDYANEALKAYNIDPKSFNGGYYYSIQELTGILLCKTDYLLHFSGDSLMKVRKPWIAEGIKSLEINDRFFVANPGWNYRTLNEGGLIAGEDDQFWHQKIGFSDQCYLIKVNRYKADIYNDTHVDNTIFPAYGGEMFEKRVNAYMMNNNLLRLTSKHAAYRHRNYPKYAFKRWVWINLGIKIE